MCLNPDSNYCSSYGLSPANKVTNIVARFTAVLDDIKQFADQVRVRLISQFISNISRFLQKLLRYFNGTSLSTVFVPSLPIWSFTFLLKSKESLVLLPGKSTITSELFKTDPFL